MAVFHHLLVCLIHGATLKNNSVKSDDSTSAIFAVIAMNENGLVRWIGNQIESLGDFLVLVVEVELTG